MCSAIIWALFWGIFVFCFREQIGKILGGIGSLIGAYATRGGSVKTPFMDTTLNPNIAELIKEEQKCEESIPDLCVNTIYGLITTVEENAIKAKLKAKKNEKDAEKEILINLLAHSRVEARFYKTNFWFTEMPVLIKLLEYLSTQSRSEEDLERYYDTLPSTIKGSRCFSLITYTNPILKRTLNSLYCLESFLKLLVTLKVIENNNAKYSITYYGSKYLIFRIEKRLNSD